MIDRKADGKLILYWMPPRIVNNNKFRWSKDDEFSCGTLYSEGYIHLAKDEVKHWNLKSVTDITLEVICFGVSKVT